MTTSEATTLKDKVEAGTGRIELRSDGSEAVLAELSSSYPLKLLSPKLSLPTISIVYVLTYGGGLVAGDGIHVEVDVQDGMILLMLTQGSTKVFKTRPGQRQARPNLQSFDGCTSQRMNVTVGPKSSLFLLPDPVTCFRNAQYNQLQVFHIAVDASVVLLDWVTSGRKTLGEEWVFSSYYTLSEVWIDNKRIARDAMLLEESNGTPSPNLPARTLAERLRPYSCYATVIIYGPLTARTVQHLLTSQDAITVFKHATRPELVWSASAICDGKGCVLRVAATESEGVRKWLGLGLRHLEDVIGVDCYGRAFHG